LYIFYYIKSFQLCLFKVKVRYKDCKTMGHIFSLHFSTLGSWRGVIARDVIMTTLMTVPFLFCREGVCFFVVFPVFFLFFCVFVFRVFQFSSCLDVSGIQEIVIIEVEEIEFIEYSEENGSTEPLRWSLLLIVYIQKWLEKIVGGSYSPKSRFTRIQDSKTQLKFE